MWWIDVGGNESEQHYLTFMSESHARPSLREGSPRFLHVQ